MSYNVFKQFLSLIPEAPLLIGTVLATANGEATIELPDGTQTKGRGDAVVGSRVFVRDGAIEGTAPALPFESIEV